jgi:peptidoglycan/LPS O-acetylase OafA/YrhL
MANKPDVRHLAYLDGLRALAAGFVVLHHAAMQTPVRDAVLPPLIGRTLQLLSYGHFAVTLFIILSGFCLMLPVVAHGELRGGAIHFFKKRARRILPPYYLAMAVSLILIATLIGNKTGSHWDASLPVTAKTLVMHIFLLQDLSFVESTKINHTFWSISVEWRIYFLFPLILLLWRKWGAMIVLTSVLVISYAGQFLLQFTSLNSNPWGVCLHFFGLFALGMMACECAFSKEKRFVLLREKLAWSVITPAMFFLAVIFILKVGYAPFYVADLVVALWAFCLLISLSAGSSPFLLKMLSWRPLVFIGVYAYSIYLIHAPVLQLVTQYIVKPLQADVPSSIVLNLLVGTLASFIVSYLFFIICERPFTTKKLAVVRPEANV